MSKFKVVDESGEEVPWDGESMGGVLLQGPWIADRYFKNPEQTNDAFEGKWFRTGDIGTVDEEGYIELVD